MPRFLVLPYIMLHRCHMLYILKAKPSSKNKLTALLFAILTLFRWCGTTSAVSSEYACISQQLVIIAAFISSLPHLSSAHCCQAVFLSKSSYQGHVFFFWLLSIIPQLISPSLDNVSFYWRPSNYTPVSPPEVLLLQSPLLAHQSSAVLE